VPGFFACKSNSGLSESQSINGIFVDFNQIQAVKKLIHEKDEDFMPSFNELIRKSGIALNEGPFSVMEKLRVPPSGDKHDYLSMGPYWWPDPSKAGGLPYIRRDGEVNPETRGANVDTDKKSKMLNNVEILTWAYYFSGEDKYAQKAIALLETWFVNPETRMNPNLQYAQGIPGICDGRGIGIIDFSRIDKVISPVQILEAHGKLSIESRQSIHEWFKNYLNWLTTSEYGIDEGDELNNHATWYDVQVAGIALFLGKTEIAKGCLEGVKTKRIATQIEPDGSQPKEIARTKSLSYSGMNLRGFTHLANMGQTTGIDLWNYQTTDGRGIRKALDFLLPYVSGEKRWEHQQIGGIEGALAGLKPDFIVGAIKTGDKRYLDAAKSLSDSETELEILLYPMINN
jgi:hypothetical protein